MLFVRITVDKNQRVGHLRAVVIRNYIVERVARIYLIVIGRWWIDEKRPGHKTYDKSFNECLPLSAESYLSN